MTVPGKTSSALRELAGVLDGLLRVRYPNDGDAAQRDALTFALLRNELRKQVAPTTEPTLEALIASAALDPEELAAIRSRCLFYGCDTLIGYLVNKRIRFDAIAREEAVLYVQDRLQRDDFRRIRAFQADRGANFVTYIWQVINNLLLDFLRAHGKHATRSVENAAPAGDAEFIERQHADDEHPDAASQVEDEKLRELLAEAMSSSQMNDAGNVLRNRLRSHLSLSSKERVFLKAMFQYDMTIAEIRELPGFSLSLNEAYRLYYQIMDKLRDAFKGAGLLEPLRELISETVPRVAVSIDGLDIVLMATQIFYLEQLNRDSTGCHAEWKSIVTPGVIRDSFNKVSKRLAGYFTRIDATTAVSDKHLAATQNDWRESGKFVIAGVAKPFRISARALSELNKRFRAGFAEKTAP